MGNLTSLLSKIRPAVDDEQTVLTNRNSTNEEFVDKVTVINVKRTVKYIMQRSSILKEMIEGGAIGIVGGLHNITTGKVEFFEETQIING